MANYSKKRPTFRSRAEMYKKSNWAKFRENVTLLFSNFKRWMQKIAYRINEKGSQRLTIMVVPHSEKKIVNLQISNYILFFTAIVLGATVATSILAISNNQLTYKQNVILKSEDETKRAVIEEYKRSIEGVNKRFTMFKGDINNIIKSVGKDQNIYNFNEIRLPDEYSNKNLPKEVADLEKLKQELDITKVNIQRMGVFIAEEKRLLTAMPSIYPLPSRARVTSGYGYRIDPIFRWQSDFHPGVDLSILPGTPIKSTAEGVVAIAGWLGGYGFLVEVKHKYGFATRYGHMMRFAPGIYVGSHVKQGQVIGYVGTTGRSTGYHVHYEVRIGDQTVNPDPFISMLP